MAISLKNYLLAKLHEVEERHEYDVATETLRAWIDLYETEPQTTEQIDLPAPNTVIWWLCRIADPEIRRKAVVGYLEHGTKMDLPFYNRVGSAIDHIDWIDTDEGIVYWMSLYETADEIPLLSEPDFTEYLELRK